MEIDRLDAGDERDHAFGELLAKVERERGFVCGAYKTRCLFRRIGARMRARGAVTFAAYAELLDRDAAEYERLVDALTINVTKFFRNPHVFDSVARHIMPALAALPDEEVRIWSAGCSSGEEPFSLAILCHELDAGHPATTPLAPRARILGTDIDRLSLVAAARASFGEDRFADTTDVIRRRYFSPDPPYQLASDVRALVRFERRDLIADAPPMTDAHLITCRNVLIYFDRDRQEEMLERFHGALVPGGFLVLGKVEMLLGRARALFTNVDGRERVYRKR